MDISVTKITDSFTPAIKNILRAVNVGNTRILLRRGGEAFLRMTRATFGTGGQYRPDRWPPLSKAYAKAVGRKNATLIRSGELMNSIKLGAPKGNYIEIYTKNRYSFAHFFGYPPNNLPQRRFMPVESSGKSMFKLTIRAEREMVNEISKGLTILSNGALPRITTVPVRMPYQRGNPGTAPVPASP